MDVGQQPVLWRLSEKPEHRLRLLRLTNRARPPAGMRVTAAGLSPRCTSFVREGLTRRPSLRLWATGANREGVGRAKGHLDLPSAKPRTQLTTRRGRRLRQIGVTHTDPR
jgi:hypothetical protein